MSGTKVNNYAIGDDNIEALMLAMDQNVKGQSSISLTEMSTTTVPKIAAGSWIEVNGTTFKFDSDETLTGSPSDGVVYIRIIPSTSTCTAEMTNTAPTWSNSKQGWYGTSGSANYRYIPFWMKKSSSTYYKEKCVTGTSFINNNIIIVDIAGILLTRGATDGTAYSEYATLVATRDYRGEVGSGTTGITIAQTGLYRITLTGWLNYSTTYTYNNYVYTTVRVFKNSSGTAFPFSKIRVGAIEASFELDNSHQHSIDIIKPLAAGDVLRPQLYWGWEVSADTSTLTSGDMQFIVEQLR